MKTCKISLMTRGIPALLVLAGLAFGTAAHADVHLSIATDYTYGILTNLATVQTSHIVTKTMAENPLLIINGGIMAAVSQSDSAFQFAFTLGDTSGMTQFVTTTSDAPGFSTIAPLRFNIVGAGGSSVGDPVSLRLTTQFIATSPNLDVENMINDVNYDRNADKTLTNFKVGDSFTYTALIVVNSPNTASFSGNLSLMPVGSPAPVPEPGERVLLGASCLAGGALWRRRRSAASGGA